MRIATWNVNSIRTRLNYVLAWLQAEMPEVVCLQETKVIDDLFPCQAFQSLGYECVVSGQKSYNGVAILSSLQISDVQVGFHTCLIDDHLLANELSMQKRIISASIEGVRIVNVYVPNGNSLKSDKYSYKLKWLECLGHHLQALHNDKEPLIVLGDFNIALEDRDLHNPSRLTGGIMASEPEREGLLKALNGNFTDVFRVFEPDSGHWSWWDYRNGAWDQDKGWRIDHIYLDDILLDFITGCEIHKTQRGLERPSDHVPVVVNMVWPPNKEANEEVF